MNKRFGSFIDRAEFFDHSFFNVSSQEAMSMDAQQRLALEGSWEALQGSILSQQQSVHGDSMHAVAVSVGISYNEYYLNSAHQDMTAFTATSGTLSVVCGRISFVLGLKGPSISIDTACSSSLVGAHLAVSSFIPNGCPRALVCGVNLTMRAETTAVLSKAGMLTADGRCKTLDASANGYMRGEACVVHLLENAEHLDNGDDSSTIAVALLSGTGVNQDGRASSLTAPNGPAQQAVIRAALVSAEDLYAKNVSILEMHGTGTALGDPIEVGAAFAVLCQGDSSSGTTPPLKLQAAKSHLLHTEPAAGAVGLTHLVQQLQHQGSHTILHLCHINPYVASNFESHAAKSGVRASWSVQRHAGSVPHMYVLCQSAVLLNASSTCMFVCSPILYYYRKSTLHGSVSSFAYQGTNSHAVITVTRLATQHDASLHPASHWESSRFWYQVTYHPLLMRCARTLDAIVMESMLSRPMLEYLYDFSVHNQNVVPAFVLLEAGIAAGMLLSQADEKRTMGMLSSILSSPLLLDMKAPKVIQTSVGLSNASLSISSGALLHMSASIASTTTTSNSKTSNSNQYDAPPSISTTLHRLCFPGDRNVPSTASAFVRPIQSIHRSAGHSLHPALLESSQQLAMIMNTTHFLPSTIGIFAMSLSTMRCSGHPIHVGASLARSTMTANHWTANAQHSMHIARVADNQLTSLKSWAQQRKKQESFFYSHSTGHQTTHAMESAHMASQTKTIQSIRDRVAQIVSQLLGAQLAVDEPLMSAGLDSIGAVELKNAVSDAFGLELPSTATFDYPSIGALSEYVAQQQQHLPGLAVPAVEKLEEIKKILHGLVSSLLDTDISLDQPLMDAGLDSITSVELKNAVQSAFGLELPATVAFDYPTIDALASYLSMQLSSLSMPHLPLEKGKHTFNSHITSFSSHQISAITGWSGTAATTSKSIAQTYFTAADVVRSVPARRWDVDSLLHINADILGSGSLRMAAWANDIELFDEGIFRLSKNEAVGMDPQCRQLLQQTWETLDDGGVMQAPSLWAYTGVYVGCVWTEYQVLQESLQLHPTTASLTGSGLNFSVGRVSYTFGLQGPCVGMDTACSSSLVAIHLAHRGLHDGETSAAFAAGTNFMIVPSTSIHLAQLGSLSLNGRSKTFDASADGYGRGEACIGMVLMKAPSDDGSQIHALLHGRVLC